MSDDWANCYKQGWGDILNPEAYSHPAKVSFSLAERIYAHAIDEGWLAPGDCVVDPFAGIGGFAFHALLNGLNWRGCELEPRFVDLAQQNIDQWNTRYGPHMPRWGSAEIVQGDSRELAGVLGGADGVVSSPPYADQLTQSGGGIYARGEHTKTTVGQPLEYGSTPGQLGAMKADGFDASISSPPFMGQGATEKSDEFYRNRGKTGKTTGTVGQEYDDKVPFEKRGFLMGKEGYAEWLKTCNLGSITTSEPNFWTAARQIIDQVYAVLRPGGHAIWVTKRFVKNKQIVEFSDQWQALCEAAGFRLVCRHRAWLVEDRGTQGDLFGGVVTKTVERKSFFRRLAEKKGSPRIDYEDVICMVKE